MRLCPDAGFESTPDVLRSMRPTRRDMARMLAIAAATPGVWAQTSEETPVPLIPMQAFARRPAISQVQLSPDGQHIAALLNIEDETFLVTRSLNGQTKLTSLLKTDNQRFHFRWIFWVGNERILTSVRFVSSRYQVQTGETRLLSVPRDGSEHALLSQERDQGGFLGRTALQFQDRVIDWMRDDGRHVMLALGEGSQALPAVYKVDVYSGERRIVQTPLRDVRDWMTDQAHRVRICIARVDGEVQIRERPVGGEWRTLWRFARLSDAECWPIGFGRNPQELWVQAWHEGHLAVFTVDLADPALPRTLRVARPSVDVAARLMRSNTGEVLGLQAGFLNGVDGQRTEIWDADLKALAQSLDQKLPERFNFFRSFSRDEQRYVLYSSGNAKPGAYYVGDRGTGRLSAIAETYPELQGKALVGKRQVRIVARDGLPLNAFVTVPRGREGKGPLPMVLLAHGASQVSEHGDFDPWTEMLANRGYLVLQVNFRGSSGSGLAHEMAGVQRWGLEMQDDLSDAVQWAVQQQLADAKRVAIVGGSYGGYAALMGAVKTPTTFRCAASFAGVTDLRDLIAFRGLFIGGAQDAESRIGKYWSDRQRLKDTSPLEQVARIQVPVLLVHGTADVVVPVAQSQDMASALKRAGKAVRYIEQKDGDHNLSRYSHRLEFFTALEGFLTEHLA
jgi:dipeptidyl aminopeptidase/acylaminoacyl peptidase